PGHGSRHSALGGRGVRLLRGLVAAGRVAPARERRVRYPGRSAGTPDRAPGSGERSRFGAFFDSTLDRLAEAAVLAGISGFYLRNLLALVFQPPRAIEQMAAGLDPSARAVLAFTALLAL